MNDSERDAEFEEFLKRRSPMHRRLSDFDHAEPSAELDRLVLGRARDAIETPAQPPMFRASRWAMPAGLAATILIAFTIVLNVEHSPQKPGAQVSASVPAPAGAAEHAGAVADAASSGASAPAANATAPSAPVASAAPPMAQERAEALAKRDSTEQRAAAPVAEPTGGPASARAEAEPAMAATAAAADSVSHPDAETWLREIARLRAEGKNADANRELAAFRRAYPSHSGTSLAQPPTR